jgi:hypothetical protein
MQDSRRRYFLVVRSGSHLMVFDAAGTLFKVIDGGRNLAFGLLGTILSGPDGSLGVYDVTRRVLFRFDINLEPLAAVPMRYKPAIMLNEGAYIHSAQIPTPARVGQPVHVVAADGSLLRSFGAAEAVYRADQRLLYDRLAAPAAAGAIWLAAPGRHVVERWNPWTGKRDLAISIKSNWFVEQAQVPRLNEPSGSLVVALWEDDGVLWLLSRDADPKWTPGSTSQSEELYGPDDKSRRYDAVLEAIDIATGTVIGTRRSDEVYSARAPSRLLARSSTTDDGIGHVEVFRATLARKEEHHD